MLPYFGDIDHLTGHLFATPTKILQVYQDCIGDFIKLRWLSPRLPIVFVILQYFTKFTSEYQMLDGDYGQLWWFFLP